MKGIRAVMILLLMLTNGALAKTKGSLPFILDDYPKAVKEAKQGNRPIFVEVWAPW